MGPSTVESTYSLRRGPGDLVQRSSTTSSTTIPTIASTVTLTSTDGIPTGWTDEEGLAYDPRYAQQIFSYTDGDRPWCHQMERPNVVLWRRLITHVTFAVSDVDKNNQDLRRYGPAAR